MQYYTSDPDAVYPISVSDVRTHLSIDAHDQSADTFIAGAIAMVTQRIEDLLPVWLYERGISTEAISCHPIPVKGEVDRLVKVVQTDCRGKQTDVTDKCGLLACPDHSIVYPPETDVPVRTTIVFTSKAYCPPSIAMAILSAVRNLYNDRQNDPLTDEIMRIIEPHRAVNI